MIEKFSDEELKQIKRELGINIPEKRTKQFACKEERIQLTKMWWEKPSARHQSIFGIIDNTLNNYLKKKEKDYDGQEIEVYRAPMIIPQDIEEEYKQMFQEILEIIKKHNRKWEGDKE